MKKIIQMFVVLLCISCSTVIGFAETGIFLGTGNVYYASGDINYDVTGYVYYNSNSTTALNISSSVQVVKNYGVYDVNEYSFIVHDAEFDKYVHAWGYLSNPITSGTQRRIEAVWSPICLSAGYSDTIFEKNGNDLYVYTSITSGYSYAGLGGWHTYWFPNSRSSSFLQ